MILRLKREKRTDIFSVRGYLAPLERKSNFKRDFSYFSGASKPIRFMNVAITLAIPGSAISDVSILYSVLGISLVLGVACQKVY